MSWGGRIPLRRKIMVGEIEPYDVGAPLAAET